jgi:hypothetical protein
MATVATLSRFVWYQTCVRDFPRWKLRLDLCDDARAGSTSWFVSSRNSHPDSFSRFWTKSSDLDRLITQ